MRAILIGPVVEDSLSGFKRRVDALHCGPGDFVIAIDGGLKVCRQLGLTPDIAIGDWDSLSGPKNLGSTPHLTLRQDKDRSDLYYASQTAISLGASELVCLGVTGGRPDHQLAMLLDLSSIEARTRRLRSVSAIGRDARYHFLSSRHPRIELKLRSGQLVSIFSLGGAARGVSLQGFRYPLRNAELKASSHGMSNEALGSACKVSLKKGRLVAMVLGSV